MTAPNIEKLIDDAISDEVFCTTVSTEGVRRIMLYVPSLEAFVVYGSDGSIECADPDLPLADVEREVAKNHLVHVMGQLKEQKP